MDERMDALRRIQQAGLVMDEKDLGALFSLLELFHKTYSCCKDTIPELLSDIAEVFRLQTNCNDPSKILRALRNPRGAGRKMKYSVDNIDHVKSLSAPGRSIREIAFMTGIPKSTVQQLLKRD